MSRITESVSGIHVKDYMRVYQGYMSKITESVSGIHVKDYRECIKDVQVNKLTATRGNELNNVYLRVITGYKDISRVLYYRDSNLRVQRAICICGIHIEITKGHTCVDTDIRELFGVKHLLHIYIYIYLSISLSIYLSIYLSILYLDC